MTETITTSVVFPVKTGNQYEEFLNAGLRDCVVIEELQ
jgi:hypothetical protein